MKNIINNETKELSLFSEKRFIFLGESIHGVSEFTRLRLEIAKRYFHEQAVLVFEADSTGMLLSHIRNDDAVFRLNNFPKVLRCREMLDVLKWAISKRVPCFGIDCIPRLDITNFPADWLTRRQNEIRDYLEYRSADNFFELRDKNG